MLQSLREETEGILQMLLSLRKNGLTSLFKEVRVFKVYGHEDFSDSLQTQTLGSKGSSSAMISAATEPDEILRSSEFELSLGDKRAVS